MSLSPQFLDELRARTTLSSLIGRTVKIQRAGREFKACCPFHNEKTPSFTINDDKGFYHCFGCGAHGDAIRWLTDQRGLPFIDAVKELADAAGMDMPAQDARSAERARRAKGLHEAMAGAADWFSRQLQGIDGAVARELLERRGIKPETARKFGIGYAPDGRGRLREALKEYGDALLIEAGLLVKVEDKEPYDRFRGRLMIPIKDARGKVIAFGGRIIGEGEPKYLNSPETPLFDKGRTLYNLDLALPPARKAGRVIAVEGYMDVIALAQGGVEETVAPLGTALTEHQIERLWSIADTPVLCFDGDAAGQKAAIRAATRALPLLKPGKSLAFAAMPEGLDPDDVIGAGGKKAIEGIVHRARSLSEFIWVSEFGTLAPQAGPDERAGLMHRLLQAADTIGDPVIKSQYRQTFHDLFYDVFGSKARRMTVVQAAASEPIRQQRKGFDYTVHRAVLLGLMRYPEILCTRLEEVAQLPIGNRKLLAWREKLIDLAMHSPSEEVAEITLDILNQEVELGIEPRSYQEDLAYSFYFPRKNAPEPAEDLNKVLDILLDEHVARRAAALANAEATRQIDEASFATQQARREQVDKVRQQLTDWMEEFRYAA